MKEINITLDTIYCYINHKEQSVIWVPCADLQQAYETQNWAFLPGNIQSGTDELQENYLTISSQILSRPGAIGLWIPNISFCRFINIEWYTTNICDKLQALSYYTLRDIMSQILDDWHKPPHGGMRRNNLSRDSLAVGYFEWSGSIDTGTLETAMRGLGSLSLPGVVPALTSL